MKVLSRWVPFFGEGMIKENEKGVSKRCTSTMEGHHGSDDLVIKSMSFLIEPIFLIYKKFQDSQAEFWAEVLSEGDEDMRSYLRENLEENINDQRIITYLKSAKDSTSFPFDQLPPEMIVKIFKNLTILDFLNCQQVNKLWNRRLNDGLCAISFSNSQSCEVLLQRTIQPIIDTNTRQALVGLVARRGLILAANVWLLNHLNNAGQTQIDDWQNLPDQARFDEMIKHNEFAVLVNEIGGGDDGEVTCPIFNNVEDYDQYIIARLYTLFKACPIAVSVFLQTVNIVDGYNVAFNIRSTVSNQAYANLSLPDELVQDSVLSRHICPISSKIPLIPVIDKCGHIFDYLPIKKQIEIFPRCPISGENIKVTDLTLCTKNFLSIQRRIIYLKETDSPLLSRYHERRLNRVLKVLKLHSVDYQFPHTFKELRN